MKPDKHQRSKQRFKDLLTYGGCARSTSGSQSMNDTIIVFFFKINQNENNAKAELASSNS